jgi:hypothetical protein
MPGAVGQRLSWLVRYFVPPKLFGRKAGESDLCGPSWQSAHRGLTTHADLWRLTSDLYLFRNDTSAPISGFR